MDQSKKTMRHFYCRDALWETFEQMANDFDCSIDYLVNEAMRYYARSKNYQSAQPSSTDYSRNPVTNGDARPTGNVGVPFAGASASANGLRRAGPPPPPLGSAGTRPTSNLPVGHPPGYVHGSAPPPPPMVPNGPGPGRRQTGVGGLPAVGRATPEAIPAASVSPTLFLVFNNQRIPIDKDQFIIGRGSKTSDLAIKDGNISRKHAAVIRRNGTYYIKDLGSTNGIDYKGMRIDNKRIDEGDVFHLCDYELRFTYR